MKGIQLHNNFARRREAEQMRIDKSAAVDRYFDKWGQITTRFDNWTAPEYYQMAENAAKMTAQKKEHDEQLERRRTMLRKQLEREKNDQEQQLKELRRHPKSRSVSNEILTDIHNSFRRSEEERRRLELESQLYKQWRFSDREAAILHDSKSDHQAMAKMNWLDKQVLLQVERDAEKRNSEERTLRLREESRFHAEHMKERRQERDLELADVKRYQESHVFDLNTRTKESDSLRQNENRLRQVLSILQQEQQSIIRNMHTRQERFSVKGSVNVRRIKLVLRQRSEAICADLREDIALLDRLAVDSFTIADQFNSLRDEFTVKHDEEKQLQQMVEAMYESEAKTLLVSQERLWAEEEGARAKRVWRIIEDNAKAIQESLSMNVEKQRDLFRVKEAHLKSIQTSNARIKDLMEDQRKDEIGDFRSCPNSKPSENARIGNAIELLRKSSISSDSSELSVPEFGRKKIAWT